MWTFLNPMFLWAAAAVLVPLLLHFMQRRRRVRIRFSTLRFLKLAQKRAANRVRMENFLLWLLRTLVVLCLALAFALPVMRFKGLGSFMGTTHRDVAIVLDVSYSMGYESGQRSVWEAARAAAVGLVEGLQKGDRVCIFLADEDVTPLIEQPTTDLDMALAMLRAQRVQTCPSQLLPATLAAAAALDKSARSEREVHIITDGQALPWRSFAESTDAKRPAPVVSGTATAFPPAAAGPPAAGTRADLLKKDIAFFVTLVGAPSPQNAFPLDVRVEPAVLMADTTARLAVRIGRSGPAQSVTAALAVDGRETTRATGDAKEDGAAEFDLAVPPLTPGAHAARISVPADSLSIDDAFYFVLRCHDALQVLCIGTAPDAFYLMKALNPGSRTSSLFAANRVEPAALATRICSAMHACSFVTRRLYPGRAFSLLKTMRAGAARWCCSPATEPRPRIMKPGVACRPRPGNRTRFRPMRGSGLCGSALVTIPCSRDSSFRPGPCQRWRCRRKSSGPMSTRKRRR
jgi:hypothetical protein